MTTVDSPDCLPSSKLLIVRTTVLQRVLQLRSHDARYGHTIVNEGADIIYPITTASLPRCTFSVFVVERLRTTTALTYRSGNYTLMNS